MKLPTPAPQRALLQLVESMLISASVAGLLSVGPLFAGDGTLDWSKIDYVFLFAFAVSLAHSIVAYFKPIQPVAAMSAEAIVDAIERRYETKHFPDVPQASPMPVALNTTASYQPIQMSSQYNPMSFSAPTGSFAWMPAPAPDLTTQITTPHPAMQNLPPAPAQQPTQQPTGGQGAQQ